MSETSGPRHETQPAPAEASQATEYQPPAIAWEEPLEAIAALTCATFPGGCEIEPMG